MSIAFISVMYTKITKQLIRNNANLLILFKQNGINLKHVYNDHVNTDMSYENFCKLCHISKSMNPSDRQVQCVYRLAI